MSTNLLHHAWGIRGYTYVCTQYQQGNTIFRIKQNTPELRSSCCGSKKVIKRGVTTRTFKTVPIGNREVFIELPVQRMECLEYASVRQVNIPLFLTKAKLYEEIPTLCVGIVPPHDDPGYGPSSWRNLGYDQGHSSTLSAAALC
uniref:Zinc-finger of transposase IS204/IS1001/IS1096/IS1165 n=1 Tax=Candidatus Kentrum sp. TC TaxID=2126339 RepID=A0A450Z9Y7_9GAMM|nr:MAG: zinc-finger of transposase IS204/IS1001/IS1096/IS1165 [Candidatus Kentron sp. TC]VFK50625.1 MAG: zinc-finger of transposase IS204/IS1001/IS1096/IS1165 [Candidatus Kentron sp. TC]VFK63807.1 MAG: zinc-finger of transposase IS204/IS1001/IS1096/IS1165 [Candidatus Kentron sp. TC]